MRRMDSRLGELVLLVGLEDKQFIPHSSAVRSEVTSFATFADRISPEISALLEHQIYKSVRDQGSLRIFMESHAFAVWDFMSLLKSLQRSLTGTKLPWTPPENPLAARLVNEIVLAEESDEVYPGSYSSHFELYLAAMDEVGADSSSIREFVESLRRGIPLSQVLLAAGLPGHTSRFLRFTMASAELRPHEVASAFLFGREEVIPQMFSRFRGQLDNLGGMRCDCLKLYLERHITLDSDHHGPMGRKLLESLCGSSERLWGEAFRVALSALRERRLLWDGITAQL